MSQIPDAGKIDFNHEFSSISYQAFTSVKDQLVTHPVCGVAILRPSKWIDIYVEGFPNRAHAYLESIDIWDSTINLSGRLTPTGQMMANRVIDPSSEKPTLEDYIAEKYEIEPNDALAITSRAMWDLIMIRGLPETDKNT